MQVERRWVQTVTVCEGDERRDGLALACVSLESSPECCRRLERVVAQAFVCLWLKLSRSSVQSTLGRESRLIIGVTKHF